MRFSPGVHLIGERMSTLTKTAIKSDGAEPSLWNQVLKLSSFHRKILCELSSDSPAVSKIDEEKTEEEVSVSSAASAPVSTSIYQTGSGQYSQYTHEQGYSLSRDQPRLRFHVTRSSHEYLHCFRNRSVGCGGHVPPITTVSTASVGGEDIAVVKKK